VWQIDDVAKALKKMAAQVHEVQQQQRLHQRSPRKKEQRSQQVKNYLFKEKVIFLKKEEILGESYPKIRIIFKLN